jgi:hypothetical protein
MHGMINIKFTDFKISHKIFKLEPLVNAVCLFLVLIIKFEIRPERPLKYNGKSVSSIEKFSKNFKTREKRKIKSAEMENACHLMWR